MTSPMTERPDEKLQALCDAATPGPWHASYNVHGDPAVVTDPRRPSFSTVAQVSVAPADYGRANTAFIAAARSAVPSLLAGRRELLARVVATEKKLAAVEAECDRIERMPSREPYNTLTGRGMALAATKIRAALAEGVTR